VLTVEPQSREARLWLVPLNRPSAEAMLRVVKLLWTLVAQLTAADSPYTLQRAALPLVIVRAHGEIILDPRLIHDSLGLPESIIETASGSVQPILLGSLSWQTDRPTNRRRYFVCNNRPHLRT